MPGLTDKNGIVENEMFCVEKKRVFLTLMCCTEIVCLYLFVFYLFTHISTVLFANFEHMLQIKLNLVLSFLL